MIDLVAVEALVAVDRCGSVGGAATELGFTPSAVSQQVKRLERQVDAVLLERAGRGVVLTAAGRRLAAEGRALAAQVEELRSRLHADEGRPVGLVRLAAFATAVRGLVPDLLAGLRESAPGLDVEVREIDPWDAVAEVAAGRCDVALVHHWEGIGLRIPAGLRSERVLVDTADVLVHSDDPLAGRAWVTPTELADHAWVSTPPGTICHAWFDHMFRGAERAPRVDYRCVEFASQVALVERGLAVALVPRLGRGRLPADVVAVPVRDPEPTRPVDVVWRASMTASPAVAAVRDRLRGTSDAPSRAGDPGR
ncbi:molybdate transport repressor ModE-like protein [Sediminihabitans luteus]|uniref:Molybdate transport repressor ModE-like protein n=1 Tax=Sediminihabitans luteus TaxID=1138585 RepID=A0A2M9D0E3_9CELL|nr:LysR family transcriptional regulator [Sediminihabitans luteus]PJJ77619.1 molybdate transport repressor ModE-like protein [Sediminihabitans luteus]GII98519.1 LysR family transcriptional regulator [Sediminihabitans luteus]